MTVARASKWAPFATIAAAAIAMTWWTWGTWPDVIVDFGGEMYAAWRLLEGQLLYRDVAWVSGPLSPYLNATLLRFFGVGIRTLVFSNLVVVGLLSVLIWRLIAIVSSRFAATIAVLVFVTLFAFSQFSEVSNYNFVTPYAYGITHGVVLSFVAIACFSWFLRSGRLLALTAAGIAAGLTILAKAEVSLATVIALLFGFGAAFRTALIPADQRLRAAVCFLGALLVPIAGATLLFWSREPLSHAVSDTFGAWRFLVTGSMTSSDFYLRLSGLDDPAGNLRALAGPTAAYLIVFGAAVAAALRIKQTSGQESLAITFAIAIAVFSWSTRVVSWDRASQPLPLIMLLLLSIFGFRLVSSPPTEPAAARRAVLRLTLVIFAFGLLWKILLNPTFSHYGFALVMPATLVLVAMLLDWLPLEISRRGGARAVFQAISLAAVVTLVASHLLAMSHLVQQKTTVVGAGADRLIADSRGEAVRDAVQDLEQRLQPADTLVVLPEGVMLNYLSRRRNPIRFITFIPPLLAEFGESNVIAALDRERPDYIAVVQHDTGGMGARFFGTDYAQQLMSWVTANYAEVRVFGARPNTDNRFGILLMKAEHK